MNRITSDSPQARSARDFRRSLKERGYHQVLLNLDPETQRAIRRIKRATGSEDMSAIIRVALQNHALMVAGLDKRKLAS